MTTANSDSPQIPLRTRWQQLEGWRWIAPVVLGLLLASLLMILEQRSYLAERNQSAALHLSSSLSESLITLQRSLLAAADSGSLSGLPNAYPAIEQLSRIDRQGTVEPLLPGAAAPSALDPVDLPLPDDGNALAMISTGSPVRLLVGVPAPDGMLIAQVDPAQLWDPVFAGATQSDHAAYLVSEHGTLLAGHAYRQPHTIPNLPAPESGQSIYRGLDDQWVVGQVDKLPGLNALIVTETPLSMLLRPGLKLLAAWLASLTLAVLIRQWNSRRSAAALFDPLDRVRHGAAVIAQQDYAARIRLPDDAAPEWSELAHALNQLGAQLQMYDQQLADYDQAIEEVVDQRARELSRKTRQMEKAAALVDQAAARRSVRQIAEWLDSSLRERFGVYHSELLLRDDRGENLLLQPAANGEKPLQPPRAIPLDAEPVHAYAVAARENTPVYIPDTAQDPRFQPNPDHRATRSVLVLPLQADDTLVGVLALQAEHRDAFAKDTITVLEGLAHSLAIALRNAQAFEKLEVANRDLAQAALHTRQASLIKSRFLASASEQLSSPLATILTETEAILSGVYGPLPEKVLAREQSILNNGRQIQALLDDMRDLSTIESGHLSLNMDEIPLAALLTEVMQAARALHQTAYADHVVTLEATIPDDLPRVEADIDRLRHILMALLSNALQATTEGKVSLHAETGAEALHVQVIDTGGGIPPDLRPHLFEAFKPADARRTLAGKGSGLGLPLARLLAQMHGGDLALLQTSPAGSTFDLRLPLPPPKPPA